MHPQAKQLKKEYEATLKNVRANLKATTRERDIARKERDAYQAKLENAETNIQVLREKIAEMAGGPIEATRTGMPKELEGTISDLENTLKSIDDPDKLEHLYLAENDHKDRKGARDAIQSRLDEVNEASEEKEA